jgi:hypothetical protein
MKSIQAKTDFRLANSKVNLNWTRKRLVAVFCAFTEPVKVRAVWICRRNSAEERKTSRLQTVVAPAGNQDWEYCRFTASIIPATLEFWSEFLESAQELELHFLTKNETFKVEKKLQTADFNASVSQRLLFIWFVFLPVLITVCTSVVSFCNCSDSNVNPLHSHFYHQT